MTWLRPHLDHGILELDTNTAERAMRSIAIGGKNDLFVGSRTRGRAAAIAHTLIETAKLNGIDPQAWLADTLARIPDYKSAASTICCHERPQRKASTPSLTPDVMGGAPRPLRRNVNGRNPYRSQQKGRPSRTPHSFLKQMLSSCSTSCTQSDGACARRRRPLPTSGLHSPQSGRA